MKDDKIQKILKENKDIFDALEEYDKTDILKIKGKIVDTIELENQFEEGLEDLKSEKIRKLS